jgi:hypothetical protein
MTAAEHWQLELDGAIDEILDILEESSKAGVELDPLATIVDRLRARGAELDVSALPPIAQMLLGGMGVG